MFTSGLTESYKPMITLAEVDAHTFELIIDFIYTGRVVFTEQNVQDLCIQANYFQIPELEDGCLRYMLRSRSRKNSLNMLLFAEVHKKETLKQGVMSYICCNFSQVKNDDRMVSLPGTLISELLDNPKMHCKEEDVYNVAISWLDNNPEQRAEYCFKLLSCVRFPFVSPGFMLDVVINSAYMESEKTEVRELLRTAVSVISMPSRLNRLPASMKIPREFSPVCEAIFLFGEAPGPHTFGQFVLPNVSPDRPSIIQPLEGSPCDGAEDACVVGNTIYVYGSGIDSNEFWIYHIHLKTWSRAADLPGNFLTNCPIASIDDKIYSFGGYIINREQKSIYEYDVTFNKWSLLPCELPMSLSSLNACAFGKYVYLFGGCFAEEVSQAIICFDSVAHKCTMLDTPVPSTKYLSSAMINGIIYLLGGEDLYGFNPLTETLSVLNRLPPLCDLESLCPTALHGKLYVFGGCNRQGDAASKDIHCYDPTTDIWTWFAELSENFAYEASVSVHNLDKDSLTNFLGY